MSEIDWSKAPEGATHWGPETQSHHACWYMQSAGGWLFSVAKHGLAWLEKDHIEPYRLRELVARPRACSGEGLPPVGTVCECQVRGYGEWQLVTVIAHHKGHAWIAVEDGEHCMTVPPHGTFRPLKTPEQIEAEEREKEIAHIAKCILNLKTEHQDNAYLIAEVLHGIGYRKVEGGAE